MIKNYFKTTFRYFWSYKIISLINIAGLAIGICVCFFAFLYIHFELNHDNYNTQANNIYRLVTDVKTPAGISYESAPAPMGPAVKSELPGVKEQARVFMDDMILQSNPANAGKEEVAYADSSVFRIFSWPLLRGDISHIFIAANDVVLSETAAKKYFGTKDPIGQTLLINGKTRAMVTGIMKDIPYNAHLRVDILFSLTTLVNDDDWNHNWTRFGFYTYLLLQPGQSPAGLQAKFPAFVNSHFDQSQFKYQLSIEPLKKVYLYGKARGHRTGASATGSITNVYTISVIAVLVLFIACFNFINLTTAFSLQRAKEIGVRKVLGASKSQLVVQFFIDAIVLCLIAFVIAIILAALLLPLFNQLAGNIVVQNIFGNIQIIGWMFSIALIVGVLSGVYPAFVLSGFKPVTSLKGDTGSSGSGFLLRKTLVVMQFSISIFLIIATAVVYIQLNFMQNQDLGFQKKHELVIDFQFDQRVIAHADLIKQQLSAIPGVEMVSYSSSIPGTSNNRFNTVIENSKGENQAQEADVYFVEDNFLKQFRINVIAGRGFSRNFTGDTLRSMLVNESMVKSLGYTSASAAIGKHFTQLHHEGTIVGVVQDFHYHSFLERVQPLTIRIDPGFLTDLTLSISFDHIGTTIAQVQAEWKHLAPNLPFVYFFSDEAYNAQYIAQERFGQLFICFTCIAIIISCLGLLGLSAYNVVQRQKEIGVRKVLGASVGNITLMLSKDFVKLIIIALLITSPIAWWLMENWLQNFAYRINIPLWVFLFSGLSAIVIAFATISFQSIRAALVNPVKSLRSE